MDPTQDLHELLSRLQDAGEQWRQLFCDWYTQRWERALARNETLDVAAFDDETILEALGPERSAEARRILRQIDESYRPRWQHRHSAPTATLAPQTEEPTAGSSETTTNDDASSHSAGDDLLAAPTEAFEATPGDATPGDAPAATGGSPQHPQRIGNYEIHRELGRGGMGVVYLARQRGIERWAAVKMILDPSRSGEEGLRRFLSEAQAVGRFQHENIVRVYEIGQHQGRPYFSLEFVDGRSLADHLRAGVVTPQRAAEIILQVSQGIEYAHGEGIVHRDLKPANILLTSEGAAKITDFGLAKVIDADSELSREGLIIGTPSYMAPEQAEGRRDIGPAADIYALGATLYCLLAGRPPFVGATAAETILEVLSSEPAPPRRWRSQVPLDLETICLKCLHKEPHRRYATAAEVGDDLQRFLRHEPIAARRISRAERLLRWARRNKATAAVSTIALSLAVALMVGGPLAAYLIHQEQRATLAQQRIAEQNAERANQAKTLAQQNEQRAQANADEALVQQKNAVDMLRTLVFQVQRSLQDRPRLQALRRQLIEMASQGMEKIDTTTTQQLSESVVAAAILRRVGDLNLELGRTDQAREPYQACFQLLSRLDEKDELPNRGHNLSTIHRLIADVDYRTGRYDDAQLQLDAALRVNRRWIEESPKSLEAWQSLAETLGNLGMVSLEMGNLADAQKWHQESADARAKILRSTPKQLAAHTELVGARWSLARVAFQNRDWERAEQEFLKLEAANQELERRTQGRFVSFPWNSAKLRVDLGIVCLYQGRLHEAVEHFDEAILRYRSLTAKDVENFRLLEDLADALYASAVAREQLGLRQQAEPLLIECVEIRSEAIDLDPQNLPGTARLALALARLGRADEAIRLAERLKSGGEPQQPLAAKSLFDLAGVRAQIGAALARGGDDRGAQRQVARACHLLQESVDAGYSRKTDINLDPDLAPIRSGPPGHRKTPQPPPREAALPES